jgi:hypothetical protein
MRDRRMMIWGILAMLLIGSLAVVGCGSTPTPEPTPEPPSIKEYQLADICESDDAGVPEAAPYSQTSGIHPIVYATGRDSEYSFSHDVDPYAPPSEWKPQELAETELVACIRLIERQVEECPYTLSSGLSATLYRIQMRAVVSLREAQTGKVVATSKVIEGVAPAECQDSEKFQTGTTSKYVYGDVASGYIHAWLKQYVEIP